jgi:acyl-CoA reductase-like NAD-dependent aldehyde dehydrogenase
MVQSISANGGRSCINASGVWTPKNADKIAEAVAQKLATWQPLPADHPDAKLALFANPTTAERINMMIDANMPGARDLTHEIRGTPRLVKQGRCAWLLPTIIRAPRDHALANKEFLFPFAAVVECPQDEIPDAIGDTLVGTVITQDSKFRRRMMACDNIDRLNVGPVPTFKLSWDQPHEGNLFEHLYRQRAFQIEAAQEENVATGLMP